MKKKNIITLVSDSFEYFIFNIICSLIIKKELELEYKCNLYFTKHNMFSTDSNDVFIDNLILDDAKWIEYNKNSLDYIEKSDILKYLYNDSNMLYKLKEQKLLLDDTIISSTRNFYKIITNNNLLTKYNKYI